MGRVRIKDVAQAAGVSSATVSYVMNGLGKVTPEVETKVRKVAADLGYFPNRTAMALKTGRHRVIGCLLPTLVSPIFPQIAQAAQAHAEALGFATLLIDTGDQPRRERDALRRLADFGVDGAIAVLDSSTGHPLPKFPVVTLDAPFPGCDVVQADHFAGGHLMAEAAARMGHRRIGLLSGAPAIASSRARRAGLLEGAQRHGLDLRWEREVPLSVDLTPAARTALAGHEVSLVACVNDMVAIGALSAARDLGLRVPDDLSVIGFDDIAMASWPLIGLTTVRQPLLDLARGAVDLLLRRIEAPERPLTSLVLPVGLVERATTRNH